MTKSVTIIGGGIAGLTVATLLNEAGFQVTVVEASSSLGGLAKSQFKDGYPSEHSCRVFNDEYVCLFDMINRFSQTEKILVPVGLSFECEDKEFLIEHAKSMLTYCKNFLTLNFVGNYRGITFKDKWKLLKNYIFYIGACEARWNEIAKETVSDYLRDGSEGFKRTFYPIQELAFAVRENTTKKLSVFFQGEHLFDYNYYMLNGPTSLRIFSPWQAYLEKNKVKFIFNQEAVAFNYHKDKIDSITFRSGETMQSGLFIFAGTELQFAQIFANVPILASGPPHHFNVEHSNGCQFYLSQLPVAPQSKPHLFRPGIVDGFIDAPWKIVSIVQGKGFWQDVPLPAGCEYILSLTFTDATNNGVLYHKPVVECTAAEILDEVLAQIDFPDRSLIVGHYLDDHLLFFNSDVDYQAKKPSLPPHLAVRQQSGGWYVNLAPLYTPTPDDVFNEPQATTLFENLFLAGHFCATFMPIPTMEKACESGYRAAAAVLKQYLPEFPYHYPLRSYQTGHFAFLRYLDSLIFNHTASHFSGRCK